VVISALGALLDATLATIRAQALAWAA